MLTGLFCYIFFLFGVISVQIKYYVVTSRKVKLNRVSVKLFASYIDEMWGASLENVSSWNRDEMSGRLELPSTGVCKE